MNSYFEQSGFYGQAAAAGTEQAYRFPLGLAGMGVSPYSAAQHQTSRPTQDSYDNTSPKASSLYSPLSDSAASYKTAQATPSGGTPSSGTAGGGGTTAATQDTNCKPDQNGYSSLSKELNSAWSSSGGASGSSSTPVRPSACTPDPMARYTPSAVDAAARDRWMNTCTGLSSQATQPQLQQASANHTFYPWMAIAGKERLAYTYRRTSMGLCHAIWL